MNIDDPQDPKRLLDDAGALPPDVHEALDAVSHDAPSAAELERITRGVMDGLGAGAASVGGAGSATVKSLWLQSSWSKLVLLAALGGGASLWWVAEDEPLTASSSVPADRPLPSVAPAPEARVPARREAPGTAQSLDVSSQRPHVEALAPQAPAVIPPVSPAQSFGQAHGSGADEPTRLRAAPPRATLDPAHAPAQAPPRRDPRPASRLRVRSGADSQRPRHAEDPRAAESPRPQDETAPDRATQDLRLLARAQRELANDPAKALGLLRQHRDRFLSSSFAQERDALLLDALHRLGDDDALRREAARFLRAYPESPHRPRVQTLMQP